MDTAEADIAGVVRMSAGEVFGVMVIRANPLDRADALLAEAAGASDAAERFRTSYLAALRGAGVALEGRMPRTGSRSAWVMLPRVHPALAGWADYFAAHSEARAAIESGRSLTVTMAEANRFHAEVSRFLTVVEELLEAEVRSGCGSGIGLRRRSA